MFTDAYKVSPEFFKVFNNIVIELKATEQTLVMNTNSAIFWILNR